MSWESVLVAEIPVATVPTGTGDRQLELDLYIPKRSDAHPAGSGAPPLVVYVHGGGWQAGTNDRPPAFRSLLKRGFAVASLQYRFSDEGTGIEMLADLRRAVQIAHEQAAARGADVNHWFLWGISAGGHLVSFLAHRLNDEQVVSTFPASESPEALSQPTGVAPWCGVFDLNLYSLLDGVGEEYIQTVTEIGNALTEGSERKQRELSPVTYASPSSPPHFFVHGDQDRLVPPRQSSVMHEALLSSGVHSEIHLVPGGNHGMPPGDSEEIERTMEFFFRCIRMGRS